MADKFDITKIQGIVFGSQEEKAIGRGKKIGRRFERFDPNAIDGDMDGTVQEGTSFERPAGPQNMPKIKPIEVPRPEEVPIKPPVPSTPTPAPTKVPDRPREPAKTSARKLSGSISKKQRAREKEIIESMFDALEQDQSRIKKIKDPKKRRNAISNHNAIWQYTEDLLKNKFDSDMRPEDFNGIAFMISDISGGMPPSVRERARELASAYKTREKDAVFKMRDAMADGEVFGVRKDEELRTRTSGAARKLRGSIGREDRNTFDRDDDQFGEDFLDPAELSELNRLEGEVLDDMAEQMATEVDWDAEMEKILSPDAGVDKDELDEAKTLISNIKNWLKDHPFNREARDYEQSEWADDEYDSQAQRYAPRPTEFIDGEDIDWDKLLKNAGLTPQQKEDYELTDDELAKRQAQRAQMLGSGTAETAERAKIWSRVQNGEGFREIAPDYPDMHWSLVRDMSRQGATEAGMTKAQSRAAEQSARAQAKQRAINAAAERLMDRMINASSQSDLRNRLQEALDEAKDIKKRTSNEYQMIRKKQVELWRLASMLFETMPDQKEGEPTLDYAERLKDWFVTASPSLRDFAEQINNGYDISTATDRSYDFQNDYIRLLEDKIRGVQGFWKEVQDYRKNKPAGPTNLSGSMSTSRGAGVPKGVRVSAPKGTKATRELEAIDEQIQRLLRGSFGKSVTKKRSPNLNSSENTAISIARASNKYPRGFFKPKRKPKKA